MVSELLTAVATICETVERIALSCSVLTKLASLKKGTSASRVVKIAIAGVKTVVLCSGSLGLIESMGLPQKSWV